MPAIISDQFRILNAANFVAGVADTSQYYYSFIGLPNSQDITAGYGQTDWNTNTPAPMDGFKEYNDAWDTMLGLKQLSSDDVQRMVKKTTWTAGTVYEMYKNGYTRENQSPKTSSTNLYDAQYYVVNSDLKVYLCINNGQSPDNPQGRQSLDEPTFVDLEPRTAGTSGDGYLWKYLYTIKPADIVKFESTDFIPVPNNWSTSNDAAAVRDNAVDGSIKIVSIKNRGAGLGAANQTYTGVPIAGDGTGAECTVTIDGDSKIDSVTISSQGSGYTFGNVDLSAGGVPTGSTIPVLDVIITPQGGHGHDIYRELGAYSVLLYSRIENDNENPDFITGNQFSRIGIVQNPESPTSTNILTADKVSAVTGLRLVGSGYSTATFTADAIVTQLVGTGQTAVGRVVSYDQTTGVLKLWQDRRVAGFSTVGTAQTNPSYGYDLRSFTGSPSAGGSRDITPSTGLTLSIDNTFSDNKTTINNRTYYLGMDFVTGVAAPEVKQHSGDIIYVDNRPSITRSSNQKEDIKVILQF